ncbi:hypothetical protein AD998_21140 [bacterium 336/3]|nr:hypothetical protein AD998_21140 [bacterium 336/3]
MASKKRLEWFLVDILKTFINDSQKGRRLQKNGSKIRIGTIKQYEFVLLALQKFEQAKNIPIRVKALNTTNQRIIKTEQNYWKKIYKKLLDYFYDDLKYYDNYVGTISKIIRSSLIYFQESKGISLGSFYKLLYVPKEEIQIVVLSAEQLNFLIYNKDFEASLSSDLQIIKDIFVFGCTVALRFSDLMNLYPHNLEQTGDKYYLKVISKKTQTATRVLLPEYAKDILLKYKNDKKQKTLLPAFSKNHLNLKIKELAEKADWVTPLLRTRNRRGEPITQQKSRGKSYRFCDSLTTHTMRRTAITTMLSLGLPEYMVRKISGHAPNSKEFYRYVQIAQTFMDDAIQAIHQKLSEQK